MFEKLFLWYIQILNGIKLYKSSLRLINRYISKTSYVRKCLNVKANSLIHLKDYIQALEVYKNYFIHKDVDDEDIKALQYLKKIHECLNNTTQAKKYCNIYEILSLNVQERENYLLDRENDSMDIYDKFLVSENFADIIEYLIADNIEMLRLSETAVYSALSKRTGISLSVELDSIYSSYSQAQDFGIELSKNINNRYCVISESNRQVDIIKDLCLVKALAMLGKYTYHIVTGESKLHINKYFIEENKDIKKVDMTVKCDNIINAITSLSNEDDSKDPIVLFGSSDYLMSINENTQIRKRLEMYYRHYEKMPFRQMDCLLLGDYFDTLSYLWGYDVKREFDKIPKYDFSIIIPVRNSIKYLRETIETCLDQDFIGTFEVLISDNGWHQDVDCRKIVDEINDSRVRYIRSPYDLNLPKSFEYAYLNSSGKYLISIGADDGLLKNALTLIKRAIKKYPRNNVIMWDEAIYVWPDYSTSEKSNYYIYKDRINDGLEITEIEATPLIKKAILGQIAFQQMPIMYMATCIKREHILRIIDLTGKFEDGASQDVYTGMVNMLIENKMTYIDYPIVMGGSSKASIGLYSSRPQTVSSFYKMCWSNLYSYRYRNYYSMEYRNTSALTGLGVEYLVFHEYVKLKQYEFKHVCLNDEDYIKILLNIHKSLPKKVSDKILYKNQIDTIGKAFGENVYKQYTRKRAVWKLRIGINGSLRRFAAKLVINKRLKDALRAIYYGLKAKTDGHGSQRSIVIDCSELNTSGIKDAAVHLYEAIKNYI